MDNITTTRLLQLVSSSLPTGSFSYSQGLEWAAEVGWIHGSETIKEWLLDTLSNSLTFIDIPLLQNMHLAIQKNDQQLLDQLCDILLACRESHELQEEERIRGRAMSRLLDDLQIIPSPQWLKVTARSQLAGYAMAISQWEIPISQAALGYLWSWLENQVLTGIKIIPLGQTQGQVLLTEIGESLPAFVKKGLSLSLEEVGSSCPALALASSQHETQYTRIYRS